MTSSAPLLHSSSSSSSEMRVRRFRTIAALIVGPILLISLVIYLVPPYSSSSSSSRSAALSVALSQHHPKIPSYTSSSSYAVIFDAGSSGSRVHVYRFDRSSLALLPIADSLELFIMIKPGLSSYASDPAAAARSLLGMLNNATDAVPASLRPTTPVRVGATAGLRSLPGDASDRILSAVRALLKEQSSFEVDDNAVSVLDGTQEGSFQWITINYLLRKLGGEYSDTVGVVDLGGGSVQMAYAISESAAAKAPKPAEGEDAYVTKMKLMGKNYYLYVHSYLSYGLLAARAQVLKVTGESSNPCILAGYDGSYVYGGNMYKASSLTAGSSMGECRMVTDEALRIKDTCTHMKCTFGGVWNGGGGDGQRNLFVASFFFDRAVDAGFVNATVYEASVRPKDFEDAAKRACQTKFTDAKSVYPNAYEDNLPYICMDLVYQYALLVDGFGLDPWQQITLVKQVKYSNHLVEAAWPLGMAIEAVSA